MANQEKTKRIDQDLLDRCFHRIGSWKARHCHRFGNGSRGHPIKCTGSLLLTRTPVGAWSRSRTWWGIDLGRPSELSHHRPWRNKHKERVVFARRYTPSGLCFSGGTWPSSNPQMLHGWGWRRSFHDGWKKISAFWNIWFPKKKHKKRFKRSFETEDCGKAYSISDLGYCFLIKDNKTIGLGILKDPRQLWFW